MFNLNWFLLIFFKLKSVFKVENKNPYGIKYHVRLEYDIIKLNLLSEIRNL
jgi:hypothetical protein